MRESFGRALADYGDLNKDIVVLDVDTASSTQTRHFARRFPKRFLNVGIAEPCMVDIAVGLALGGQIPFANGFAALLSLRALEQIRTCVCYANTNVKLCAAYAGLSDYKDGPTHHALTDIALLRAMPEMTVIVPADAKEAAQWIPLIAEYNGPVYFRLNREKTIPVHEEKIELSIGRGIILRGGRDLTIVAAGSMVGRSLQAADSLAEAGIEAQVIEMHTVKPLDRDLLCQVAAETGAIVTAEEHSIIGGLGSAVAEVLGERYSVPLERVGIGDCFARTGPDPESLMDAYGLAVNDIVAAARRVLERKTA
jgi:transketolase